MRRHDLESDERFAVRLRLAIGHAGGIVRGLVCQGCNGLLGSMQDDPATPVVLARYLINPPPRRVLRKTVEAESVTLRVDPRNLNLLQERRLKVAP
jgi:hypothetical protein